jgi:hypothetical protein
MRRVPRWDICRGIAARKVQQATGRDAAHRLCLVPLHLPAVSLSANPHLGPDATMNAVPGAGIFLSLARRARRSPHRAAPGRCSQSEHTLSLASFQGWPASLHCARGWPHRYTICDHRRVRLPSSEVVRVGSAVTDRYLPTPGQAKSSSLSPFPLRGEERGSHLLPCSFGL